jgi:histone-lysine N-methyltransferase SETD2
MVRVLTLFNKLDAIIDATRKGNLARFINHCCEPNCRTAIWTINGEKRVGIFAAEDIPKDTELTYDYKFEMYGKQRRQRCKCGAENCKGFIGKKK